MEKYLKQNPTSLFIGAYIELLGLFVQFQMCAGSNKTCKYSTSSTLCSRIILRPQHYYLTILIRSSKGKR